MHEDSKDEIGALNVSLKRLTGVGVKNGVKNGVKSFVGHKVLCYK